MAKLSFRLVMPERELLATEVDMVVVPGSEGDFGVLHGHAPLISTVRPGVLEVLQGNKVDQRYLVTGSPVTILEECGRETIGRTLTFFKTADRIIVDGNEQIRTQTRGNKSNCP